MYWDTMRHLLTLRPWAFLSSAAGIKPSAVLPRCPAGPGVQEAIGLACVTF